MSMPYQRSAEVYDVIYGDKAYADEADVVRGVVSRERPGAQTLLEVGCGTGGHLVSLRESFECEGVDSSQPMLARAQTKLPALSLTQADMRSFDLGRRFDVVASLFSVIGYVRSADELEAAIGCMARHLAPGGVLLVEPWFTPAQWKPGNKVHADVHVDRDDLKVARMCVSGQRGRFAITPMHYVVGTLEGVEHFLEHHELFLAEPDELRAAFEAAGLADVRYEPDLLLRGLWIGRRP